jgi:histone acetyltransferase MYST1
MVRAGAGNAQTPKPLELGAQLRCKWREGEVKNCEVIERKLDEDTNEWKYYVHYEGLNRRLDEWVALDRFDLGSVSEEGKMTRTQKRKLDHEEHEEEGELDLATLKEHEEATKVKNINRVVMGRWQMETWYFSPFGKEYDGTDVLYVCEFDLNFFARREQLERYLSTKCRQFHPPGDEVYRETKTIRGEEHHISIYEIDPKDQRVYCENLCLLAKLFLDHKTLYYDVEPFLFYVICEVDDAGAHMVAYFSKEKHSSEEYNLACILTLPCYQRKGYGKLMIAFSYELSRREGKLGTPERPISDLGLVSYRSYWVYALLEILQTHRGMISITELSEKTKFRTDDIVKTLQAFNLIRYFGGQHSIYVSPKTLARHYTNANPNWIIDPTKLPDWWLPYPDRGRMKYGPPHFESGAKCICPGS